jgi:DNA-directed RNA polymerase subunit K/omega
MRSCRGAGDAGGVAETKQAEDEQQDKRKSDASRCKRGHEASEATTAAICCASHLKGPQVNPAAPPMKLTKYERVHILSVRATELAVGADPLLSMPGALDPLLIAMEEMNRGLLSAKVVRTLPSGEREVVALQTLL